MSGANYLERLARLIEEVSGNLVPPAYLPALAELVASRVRACQLTSPESYVETLAAGELGEEWRELLARVTVKESFLFRAPQQFAAIARLVIPELVAARAGCRRLRAWSAGCAQGEEPATLAMVFAEHPLLVGWDWKIIATDIDLDALERARRGEFHQRAVAEVPETLRQRYLRSTSGGWRLQDELLGRIRFAQVNLVHQPLVVPEAPFDLILLRNVLIYFNLSTQRRVATAVANCLAADGALFVGPAETLWQVSTQLAPVDAGDCFFYRPAQLDSPPCPSPAGAPSLEPPPSPALPPCAADGPPPAPPATLPPRTLLPAVEVCRRAAGVLAEGRLEEAAALVEQALLADPHDPLAHTLEGLVHDLAGRNERAVASYRAALFLRPELAQVRWLLAQCARRLGWEERYRQELRQALSWLSRGAERILPELAALRVPAGEALRRRIASVLRPISTPR